MPVYNAERFVAEAIRSVLDQTFSDFEFIIVDDGSRDGSRGIVERFAEADGRIVVASQANGGVVAALNRALAMASAPLLARMDADDVSLPERFRLQVEALQADPGLAAVGGHVRVVDAGGQTLFESLAPIGQRAVASALATHSPLSHPAVMMRRAPVDLVGAYRARYEAAEDYDLWLRLLDAGFRVDNLNRVLLHYRQHPGGVSTAQRTRQALATLLARVASDMRHRGLDEAVLDDGSPTEATLRALPEPLRPCEAELLEALHGLVQDAPPARVYANLAALDQAAPSQACRRTTAAFLLRSGIALAQHRRLADALGVLGRAHRADALALPRQALNTLRKRTVRAWRRLRYVCAGRPSA